MTVKPGPGASRLDPEPMPRRDMLGLLSFWSMATALVFATIGMLRLPRAAVLASPSKKFRVAIPETLPPGEAFVPAGRSVALFRDEGGVHAISIVCTHLGCIVKPVADGFECPCHGSRFGHDGEVTRGPAPSPLAWLKVTAAGDTLVVDEAATVPSGTKVNV
ncbi:MAG: Rieske 2Fe-2S domain-containing protein [Acidobacteriota bacterium]|nr:Rieske 2Fe-2S domain-containing protein [Acidobacteriota bacterium]